MSDKEKQEQKQTVEDSDVNAEKTASETEVKAEKVNDAKSEKKAEKAENKKLKEAEKKLAEAEEKLKKAEDAANEAKNMLLRTAAEFDNFKKREAAAKEKQTEFVKGETLKAIIPAIDNVNRAIECDPESADYAKGVQLSLKSLTDSLKKLGLEEINPLGEQFDVNLHQAVMRVEDDSVGENTVTQVLQTGYKLGGTVLRHAMVKVANCD